MKVSVSHHSVISDATPETYLAIKYSLTFDNPKYLENARRGFSNWQTPRKITGYESINGKLVIPRGFTRQACSIAHAHGEEVTHTDSTRGLPQVSFQFSGTLRDYQKTAVDAMLERRFGILSAPTGCGKTTMALAIIAKREQPAIIVCHTKELAEQWANRIETFLSIPKGEQGFIGGGKKTVGEKITVAIAQSLIKCVDDVYHHVGHLVIDECHHCPSSTFREIISDFDCRYMTGLSATAYRRDGLDKLIFWHIGDIIHKIDPRQLMEDGHLCQAEVQQIHTDFRSDIDGSLYYSRLLSALCEDEKRNELIINHAEIESFNDGIVLMLTDRKEHCSVLHEGLSKNRSNVAVLTGGMNKKARSLVQSKLALGEIKILIGTSQLLSEGFDCPEISTLLIASPIKYRGKLIQSIGRALRPSKGKKTARILDFVDSHIPVLAAGAKHREKVYRQMPGVSITSGRGC